METRTLGNAVSMAEENKHDFTENLGKQTNKWTEKKPQAICAPANTFACGAMTTAS